MKGGNPSLIGQLKLSDWAYLKSEFIWIYEHGVEQRYRDKKRHYPGYSALLILQGDMRIQTGAQTVEARSGQWVFPPPGPRWQRFSDAARILSIHFDLYWPGGHPLFDWEDALVVEAATVPQLEKQSRILYRTVQRLIPVAEDYLYLPQMRASLTTHIALQRAFDSWLFVLTSTLLSLGVVPSRLAQTDQRILAAVQKLDGIPVGLMFDEARLAAEVGLSAGQLDRLFNRHFDMTPRQYFDRRKLVRTKELLGSALLSIKEVAFELGFCSLPSFSRWFKKQTGTSPREYRNHVKKNPRGF